MATFPSLFSSLFRLFLGVSPAVGGRRRRSTAPFRRLIPSLFVSFRALARLRVGGRRRKAAPERRFSALFVFFCLFFVTFVLIRRSPDLEDEVGEVRALPAPGQHYSSLVWYEERRSLTAGSIIN